MSPKEFYEWAVKNKVEDETIGLCLLARGYAIQTGIDTKMLVIRKIKDSTTGKIKPCGIDIIA